MGGPDFLERLREQVASRDARLHTWEDVAVRIEHEAVQADRARAVRIADRLGRRLVFPNLLAQQPEHIVIGEAVAERAEVAVILGGDDGVRAEARANAGG